ncbi:MAG: DMT family transporter [Hoeflea sp.]|uniref:DMT family transporter n=1 Tax=Hoeflea sp. TaxID=1940281 RepID=UPI003EF77F49
MNPVSTRNRQVYTGVALMMIVAAMTAIDAVIVRAVSPDVHPFVIGFTRSLFGLLLVLPMILFRPGVLRSNFRFRHVVRATLKLASLVAFFAAFARAPLADVTAIAFTAPIFVTIGAWVFLSERPHKFRIIAAIIGFCGVLLVLKPGQSATVPVGLIFALLGSFLAAVIQLLLKPMVGRDSAQTLVVWNLAVTAPIAAIPAYFFWSMPTADQWLLLTLQGVLGAVSMALVTYAFSLAEASLLAPIEFLRLPLVAVLAYLIFGQTVDWSSWVGAAVIFAATLLMATSARRPQS